MGTQSQSLGGSSLPNLRIPALALLAVFASVQIADAWLTAVGIDRFGMAAEANPLLALPMSLLGPIAALTIAKVLSVGGAVALYRLSRHGLLAVLTLMYMFVAIAPWTWALVSS